VISLKFPMFSFFFSFLCDYTYSSNDPFKTFVFIFIRCPLSSSFPLVFFSPTCLQNEDDLRILLHIIGHNFTPLFSPVSLSPFLIAPLTHFVHYLIRNFFFPPRPSHRCPPLSLLEETHCVNNTQALSLI